MQVKDARHPNSPPAWRVLDVLDYLEARGPELADDWNAS